MLSNEAYTETWMAAEGMSLKGLWAQSIPDDIEDDDYSFDERKSLFFWLLYRLMMEGHLKLARHGKFLDGTVDEQYKLFRQSFPKIEEEMEDGIWFFDESCPGGAVWVLEDGTLEWT